MSIASDEARHIAPSEMTGTVTDYYRHGYVAGRTAEPTEAEINAAIDMGEDHIALSNHDGFVECECGEVFATPAVHARHQMKAALEAARKAVSE